MPSSPESAGSPTGKSNERNEARSSIDEGEREGGAGPTTRATRKRGREGSTEPGQLTASSSIASLAAKKSRTLKQGELPTSPPGKGQGWRDGQDRVPSRSASSSSASGKREARNVGEVRKKVEAMTHRDGNPETIQEGVEMAPEPNEKVNEGNDDFKAEESNMIDGEDSDTESAKLKIVEGRSPDENSVDQMEDFDSTQGSPVEDGETDATIKHGTKRKMIVRTPSSAPVDDTADGSKKLRENGDEESAVQPSSATPSLEMEDPPLSVEKAVECDSPAGPRKKPSGQVAGPNGSTDEEATGVAPLTAATPIKKSQATFGNFASKASPFGASKPASGSVFGAPSTSSDFVAKASAAVREANGMDKAAAAPVAPAGPSAMKKPQATFGSFSSSSSPFVSTGVKHTSAFASAPASSSALATAHSASPFGKAAASGRNAFSGWGSSSTAKSAWDRPAVKASSQPSAAEDNEQDEDEAEGAEKPGKPESFENMLAKKDESVEDTTKKLDMEERQLHTGEEDEKTLHQVRTKLFVMEPNGGWKERGTGSVHLNVRLGDRGGARLVMRAEGVFRLILNVNVFPGMFCELTEKYLKLVAMEDGVSRSFLMRFGTAKAAIELQSKMEEFVVAENGKRSRESTKSGEV